MHFFCKLGIKPASGKLVKDNVVGAGDTGFNSRTDQMGHSRQRLATAAYFSGAVLSTRRLVAEMDLPTRYTLRHNTASLMKI